MLAYIGRIEGQEWQILVHGQTRDKAKYQFVKDNPEGYTSWDIWNDIRLTRLPEWDNKPFVDSPEIRQLFAASDYDENGDEIYESFYNDCSCELCRGRSK